MLPFSLGEAMPFKDEAKRKAYHKAYSAKWNKENKDKIAIHRKKYRSSKPREHLALIERRSTLRQYSLTLESYNAMLEAQNHQCAICGLHANEHTKGGKIESLAVDHCHKTKKIRALLCRKCNLGLGYFKDNTDFLKKAVQYLIDHQQK